VRGNFSGKRGGLFIDGRGSTRRVDLRRERGWCRLWEGRGAALAGAAGCGVLQVSPGAMGEVGMVWFRGGHGRGPGGGSPLIFPVSRPWSGQGRLGLDQEIFPSMATGFGQG
jgi:hypothetical protein